MEFLIPKNVTVAPTGKQTVSSLKPKNLSVEQVLSLVGLTVVDKKDSDPDSVLRVKGVGYVLIEKKKALSGHVLTYGRNGIVMLSVVENEHDFLSSTKVNIHKAPGFSG